jgi:hypothetical protein
LILAGDSFEELCGKRLLQTEAEDGGFKPRIKRNNAVNPDGNFLNGKTTNKVETNKVTGTAREQT